MLRRINFQIFWHEVAIAILRKFAKKDVCKKEKKLPIFLRFVKASVSFDHIAIEEVLSEQTLEEKEIRAIVFYTLNFNRHPAKTAMVSSMLTSTQTSHFVSKMLTTLHSFTPFSLFLKCCDWCLMRTWCYVSNIIINYISFN